MWSWHKDRYRDQWIKIESSEIINVHIIFNKAFMIIQWMRQSFQQIVLRKLMNLELYWRLYTKNSQNEFLAYMSDLKLWNSLKKKKRQKCYDAVFVSDFLTMTLVHRKQKKWTNWILLYYFNCESKHTMSRVKRKPTRREKIFTNHKVNEVFNI